MDTRRVRARESLDLPPGFSEVLLREAGDAFAHAGQCAPRSGAGTLVWVGRYDVVEFAVVLEPDEPLASARRAVYAGMAALADAIAAHCPPERQVAFDWPTSLRFDDALLGGGRLGWPEVCAEDATPDWLVFAVMLRAQRFDVSEAGFKPHSTALFEEGFEVGGTHRLIESFCRHLMTAFDGWNEAGFTGIARSYFERLPKIGKDMRGIDTNGDLLLSDGKAPQRRVPLLPTLAAPAWLDPVTGMPKL